MNINAYLNFPGNTEEAFEFYKSVFGGDFCVIQRFSEIEDLPGKENMSEDDLNKLMHISLQIGESTLMGTDAVDGMGSKFEMGNNVSLSLSPDSKEDADKFFNGLSVGGDVTMPMADAFWGDYFGMVKDKFGINWMINYSPKKD